MARKHQEPGRKIPLAQVVAHLSRYTNDAVVISDVGIDDPARVSIRWVNDVVSAMTGFNRRTVIGATPKLFQGEETDPNTREAIRRALRSWLPVRAVVQNFRKDGRPFWVDLSIRPVADETGWFHYWVSVQRDVTDSVNRYERLRRQANQDFLTGLLNRAGFSQSALRALDLALRNGTPAAILVADLTRFKTINDEHGHEAGDLALRTVGQRVNCLLRQSDYAARLGGDEFAFLLLSNVTRTGVETFARRVAAAVQLPIPYRDRELTLGINIGAAMCPDHGSEIDDLMREADLAMYGAKAASENLRFAGDGHGTTLTGFLTEEEMARFFVAQPPSPQAG